MLTAAQLRDLQAPLKERYKADAASAQHTLRASATVDADSLDARLETPRGPIVAGLHPAAGGDGSGACSGDMLLEALVACAGVTLRAVSTALEIPIAAGRITAEGDLDFRGTLGVNRETPIGFTAIRLRFELSTTATEEQLAMLLKLTERYCVIYQTLKTANAMSASCSRV